MTELAVKNLRKSYTRGRVYALDDVSLYASSGEMLVLLGPSGCGKTTLLRCIAGLESPDHGCIEVDQSPVFDSDQGIERRAQARNLGMVFQHFALWPHMTAAQNVEFPLKTKRIHNRAQRAQRVQAVLERLQCSELAGRLPSQLSGGQQQRIALARALVAEPAVMLFDEPLSSLDAQLRSDVRRELRDLHRRLEFTGVYVTHDLAEAMELGTTVAVMNRGKIVQSSSPEELYRRPASPWVARFLGIRNELRVDRNGDVLSVGGLALDGHISSLLDRVPQAGANLFVRANELRLIDLAEDRSPSRSNVVRFPTGKIVDRSFRGEIEEYVVRADGFELVVQSNSSATNPLAVGDAVVAEVPADCVNVFSDSNDPAA